MLLNFQDVDIRTVIKSIAKITKKNFIIDPAIKGKVNIVSNEPMKPEDVYDVFLAILQVHDYTAVETGNIVKILPHDQAKQILSDADEGKENIPLNDRMITRLFKLKHVSANQLVPILRPLMNPKSFLASHDDSNTIIIADRAINVNRLISIIEKIDKDKTAGLDVVKLQHADASDAAKVIEGLQDKKAKGGAEEPLRIIADNRTNSILLSGEEQHILRAKALIAHLDTPIESEGSTQVVFLRFAKAKEMVPILSGVKDVEAQAKETIRGAVPRASGKDVLVQADEATNALIISAPPSTLKTLLSVIKKLDIRREQVLIEAIIAEVGSGKAADLGVQWRSTSDTDGGGVIGGTDFSNPSVSGRSGINAVSANPILGLSQGFNLGYFNGTTTILGNEVLNLGGLISALSSDADTNILSTPSIVTLDNEEAEITVGENVPFATGSYTSTGSTNPENPFTTYERKDVGVKLKVLPQINEGNTIRLDITQEVSKVNTSTETIGLQSTDNRLIQTSVLVEDGKILVLGGLISDEVEETVLKVPLLGDIPFLGYLFKYTYSKHEKKNLMVFLKPKIIRDEATSDTITFDKYDYMRRVQREFNEEGIPLLPDEKPPELPSLQESDGTDTNQ